MNRRNFIASLFALPVALVASAQAKLPPTFIHVWDGFTCYWFETAGDGVTDDTAAIQAAIDAAGENGTVRVPPGKYALTSALTVP